jgi:hypothetical protein
MKSAGSDHKNKHNLKLKLKLRLLELSISVYRAPRMSTIPTALAQEEFWGVSRTPGELTVVCESRVVLNLGQGQGQGQGQSESEWTCESGWRALQVEGPLDFSLMGILAGLTGTLADAGISVYAFSTFDTDYILIKDEKVELAIPALQGGGYIVSR